MKVLFLAPVEQGSGETITVLHMAQNLAAAGHHVRFLASSFAARFLQPQFGAAVEILTAWGPANRGMWDAALDRFEPDAVVVADYPLLFFSAGVAPLAAEPGWVDSLDTMRPCLVTLDHFGFAQRAMGVWLGPPHLTLAYQWFPAGPERARVLLPCPMHEPAEVDGRRGEPFRYWSVPLSLAAERAAAVRRRYLRSEDGLLVAHLVSNWAWRGSEAYGLSFYRHLPLLFDEYFGALQPPVTVVSVNNGGLLRPPAGSRLRLVNAAPMPVEEFEALLLAADLVLTENRVSISLGKAACGLRPCAVLRNSHRLLDLLRVAPASVRQVVQAMENDQPGTIYPYDVVPTGMVQELNDLVLYRENSLTQAFVEVELFGGPAAAEQLGGLLVDPARRAALRAHQEVYVERLAATEDAATVLTRLVEQDRSHR